jgi:hypothetical protein
MDLVSIARELDRADVPFTLTIVGSGPLRERIGAGLAAAGLDARVTFKENLPPQAVPPLYREADVFVLPSAYEGLSVSLLEAMAAGCAPVITHTRSGADDVIRDGVNGCLCPVGDCRGFARRIAALHKDRARLAAMGRAAQESIPAALIATASPAGGTSLSRVWRNCRPRRGRVGYARTPTSAGATRRSRASRTASTASGRPPGPGKAAMFARLRRRYARFERVLVGADFHSEGGSWRSLHRYYVETRMQGRELLLLDRRNPRGLRQVLAAALLAPRGRIVVNSLNSLAHLDVLLLLLLRPDAALYLHETAWMLDSYRRERPLGYRLLRRVLRRNPLLCVSTATADYYRGRTARGGSASSVSASTSPQPPSWSRALNTSSWWAACVRARESDFLGRRHVWQRCRCPRCASTGWEARREAKRSNTCPR